MSLHDVPPTVAGRRIGEKAAHVTALIDAFDRVEQSKD
jgi:hypothetical protein